MGFARRVLQLGALAIVIAVATLNAFELDRFFVPKELVLHATALLAGIGAWRALGRMSWSRTDRFLAAYLGLSALSALFATNRWAAERALAISASSLVVFWTARALREQGRDRGLVTAVAWATVLIAITSLLQTYGLDLTIFSENRAPGGTLGNRNFVAHAAAFGWPALLLVTMRARRVRWPAIGSALVLATLVLTRSRAALLAFGIVSVVLFAAIVFAPALRREGRMWRRLFALVVCSGAGIALALLLPNALHWRSDNPYLETMKRVGDYQSGSGHGRLVQYAESLRLSLRHPLLGVGPGNWPVVYPSRAARHDPSLDPHDTGMTSNPWPSSDWIAFVSERGIAAAALLFLALLRIAASAFARLRTSRDPADAFAAVALLGTLAAAAVAGAFDAVLLLALPSLLVWTTLGVLSAQAPPAPVSAPVNVAEPLHVDTPADAIASAEVVASAPVVPPAPPLPPTRAPRWIAFAALALCALGATHSASSIVAMNLYVQGDRASVTHAAHVDPGSYRIQLRAARVSRRRERCAYAHAAHALYPSARAALELARGCK
ncbi:MAG: O-antigen ligase family protein [Acidobacteria bacterium]|nr:O-antigen ligase family protein [Acidobacteriota bacterium]MBV9474927.1 O-antigen ligase family protein [Acidobacteriota bacterium]